MGQHWTYTCTNYIDEHIHKHRYNVIHATVQYSELIHAVDARGVKKYMLLNIHMYVCVRLIMHKRISDFTIKKSIPNIVLEQDSGFFSV